MSHTKPDDPSHWLTSWRVRQYLNRANNIPHRSDGGTGFTRFYTYEY